MCRFVQQETQVTRALLLRECRRVSRMYERQELRCNHTGRRCRAVRLPQFLMNPPHIAPSLPAAEDARSEGIKQGLPRYLINVVPREEQYLGLRFVRLHNDRTQSSTGLLRKVFIRIDEHHPVPRHKGECSISCSSKVIRPRQGMNRRTKALRRLPRIVARSRIKNNQLIHLIPQTLNGLLQMRGIIPYNITRRNPHPCLLRLRPMPLPIVTCTLCIGVCTWQLSQMCPNLCQPFSRHRRNSIVKEGSIRRMRSALIVACKCRRQALSRIPIARKAAENHTALRVEIRQIRIRRKCFVGKRKHFLIGIVQCSHGLNHLMIKFAPAAENDAITAQNLL